MAKRVRNSYGRARDELFRARVGPKGKGLRKELGYFDNAYDAAQARAKARGKFYIPHEPLPEFAEYIKECLPLKKINNDDTCAALRRALKEYET